MAQLFVMDSARLHSYDAPPGGGFQGTDHLVVTLHNKAKVDGTSCVTGKALDAVSFLLKLKDYTAVIGDIASGEFAKKLAEIAAEDFQELETKPVSGTTSCKAQRIFDQAAAVIHAEAIVAKHKGTRCASPIRWDLTESTAITFSSLPT